jgi:hypothetical protein
MPSNEIRRNGSTTNTVALTAADVGDTLAHSIKMIDVGQVGDPAAVWVTAFYGIAAVAGTVLLYHSAAPGTTPRAATNIDLVLYLSTTGDGVTGIRVGPITSDFWLTSDATVTVLVNNAFITYEAVGQV